MFNASNGRVNTSKKSLIRSQPRPTSQRDSWLSGPIDASTNAKMANDSVRGDAVRKSSK